MVFGNSSERGLEREREREREREMRIGCGKNLKVHMSIYRGLPKREAWDKWWDQTSTIPPHIVFKQKLITLYKIVEIQL